VSILTNKDTRLLVQGITGRQATWSTLDLLDYGTNVVAGVVPGRGGTHHLGVPLFNSVSEAVQATHATAALTYVPPASAELAVTEAIEAGLGLVVYPGDGLPIHAALRLRVRAREVGCVLVGPNTPGVISPGMAKLGFMPSGCFSPGTLGVVTKSGSLSYEVCWRLTDNGIGQSSVVGIGGDPIKGLTMLEALGLFASDPQTSGILVLGEVGGLDEYDVCTYVEQATAKPVIAFVAGRTAPPGRKLGHASAVIDGAGTGYEAKTSALRASGVVVAETLGGVVDAAKSVARRKS
jgi:succinyl-CoA synthetase alpha subunit